MRIDGKLLASSILASLREEVETLKKGGISPHLVVILVGDDPASVAYVKQKKLRGEEIGMIVTVQHFNVNVSTNEIILAIEQFNSDSNVHGIIVQQPLPPHINVQKITEATDPKKDVDGFHPQSEFTPPIAEGVEEILKNIFYEIASSSSILLPRRAKRYRQAGHNDNSFHNWLRGRNIVVIGKGETGGLPIINKLKKLEAEPIVIDSKTENTEDIKKQADIIVSCVGKPKIIKPDEIKKGVILLSIGMFRGEDGKLHGDYEEDDIKNIASYYTPVPGGVGPVNVAMLLKNVVKSAMTKIQ